MSNVPEVSTLLSRAVRWSVENYEQFGEMLAEQGALPKRTELIRGIIIEKMPRSPLHADLVEWLGDELRRQLPPGHRVVQERPLRMADSEPEPDVAVLPGTRKDLGGRHPTTAPLVVEVAVTSLAKDREYAALYAEAGVLEYWIILAEEQRVEVRRQPVDGTYQSLRVYARPAVLACESLPGVAVSLDALFDAAG